MNEVIRQIHWTDGAWSFEFLVDGRVIWSSHGWNHPVYFVVNEVEFAIRHFNSGRKRACLNIENPEIVQCTRKAEKRFQEIAELNRRADERTRIRAHGFPKEGLA